MTEYRPAQRTPAPTTTPLPDLSELVARAVGVVAVAGIGLIHLLDAIDTFHETRYVFWLYVALMAGCLAAAAALLSRATAWVWAAVGVLALAPLVGYVLSRTTGLPGSDDDVGNWSDPLGLASLWVEALTLGLAAYRARSQRRTSAAWASGGKMG
jgi:DMSO reductase anchor subunit